MRLLAIFVFTATLHAQRLDATYSAVAESVVRTMTGGKNLPRGLGALYVTACASTGTFRTSDAELLRKSPVAVQPSKLAIATVAEARYKANRPLRWSRDIASLGFVAVTLWASSASATSAGGKLARSIQKGSGVGTALLGYADSKVNRLEKDPDYGDLLNPLSPRYILEPGQCREGFFFVKFDRNFNKQDIVISDKPMANAAFELPPSQLTR